MDLHIKFVSKYSDKINTMYAIKGSRAINKDMSYLEVYKKEDLRLLEGMKRNVVVMSSHMLCRPDIMISGSEALSPNRKAILLPVIHRHRRIWSTGVRD
jgi:hypothetical protein